MKIDLLLKIQKKIDLFSCFLSELENAKDDIDNDCHSIRKLDTENFENIVGDFFKLFKNMNKDALEELSEKIKVELEATCKHQFIEDDIECNIDREMRITYCIVCGVEK